MSIGWPGQHSSKAGLTVVITGIAALYAAEVTVGPARISADRQVWVDHASRLGLGGQYGSQRFGDPVSVRVFQAFGINALNRFEAFRDVAAGWDCGKGRALNPESEETLSLFLEAFASLQGINASLFLTTSGNLELQWEDDQGKSVEAEFFSDRVEAYLERDDTEIDVTPAEFMKIASDFWPQSQTEA